MGEKYENKRIENKNGENFEHNLPRPIQYMAS